MTEPDAGERPELALRFRSAFSDAIDAGEELAPELLPTLLVRAAGVCLSADGAGVSLIEGQHRVPLGATDENAVAAERLQFTVGEGPCLEALNNRRTVRVDEDQLRGDWPPFYAELTR